MPKVWISAFVGMNGGGGPTLINRLQRPDRELHPFGVGPRYHLMKRDREIGQLRFDPLEIDKRELMNDVRRVRDDGAATRSAQREGPAHP